MVTTKGCMVFPPLGGSEWLIKGRRKGYEKHGQDILGDFDVYLIVYVFKFGGGYIKKGAGSKGRPNVSMRKECHYNARF